MPSLIDLRRRIRSVKNTQQITKAMKMVSAAKLRRAQQRAVQARPYANLLREMLSSVLGQASGGEGFEHPLLVQRPPKRILLVLLSGEKGLCGAFNGAVARDGKKFLAAHSDSQVSFEFVGRKGRDFFRRLGVEESGEWTNVLVSVKHETAAEIAAKVIGLYEREQVDAVHTLYTEFRSAMNQAPVARQVLPLAAAEPSDAGPSTAGQSAAAPTDYIFEQPPARMFEQLMPRYVESQIYQAMLDSSASEHASRMTAMDAATRAAGEMIDELTLRLNRIRQASITTEIIEVVSGAAAAE